MVQSSVFDTLAGTNEMGAATTMKIYGVEILNEGNGMSVDDTVNESSATFVARSVTPWESVINVFAPQTTLSPLVSH